MTKASVYYRSELKFIFDSLYSQSQILSESLEIHPGNKELQCITELDGIIA